MLQVTMRSLVTLRARPPALVRPPRLLHLARFPRLVAEISTPSSTSDFDASSIDARRIAKLPNEAMFNVVDGEGVVPWSCVRRWLYHVGELCDAPERVIRTWTDVRHLHSFPLAVPKVGLTVYKLRRDHGKRALGLSTEHVRALRAVLQARHGVSTSTLKTAWKLAHLIVYPLDLVTPYTFDTAIGFRLSAPFALWIVSAESRESQEHWLARAKELAERAMEPPPAPDVFALVAFENLLDKRSVPPPLEDQDTPEGFELLYHASRSVLYATAGTATPAQLRRRESKPRKPKAARAAPVPVSKEKLKVNEALERLHTRGGEAGLSLPL